MKPLLLLLASCAVACGELKTIVIEGTYVEAEAIEFWCSEGSAENPWEVPFAYHLECQYDDQAENVGIWPGIGVYETPDATISVTFATPCGPVSVVLQGTQVQVWTGGSGSGGLKGISFGVLGQQHVNDLYYGAYTGIYCSMLVPASWSQVPIMSNAVSWIEAMQNNETMRINSYGQLYAHTEGYGQGDLVSLTADYIEYSVQ